MRLRNGAARPPSHEAEPVAPHLGRSGSTWLKHGATRPHSDTLAIGGLYGLLEQGRRVDLVDGIWGAESPEPLGSISRQVEPKVLLEEVDCQYSQKILERQGGRPGRSRNRRHHS
jgi:hypothetical protein